MSRAAIAILSTENLLHNLNIIRKTAPRSKVIAMIKANAYGHGLRSVAQRLDQQVDLLGVASIDEALNLRKAGIKTGILLVEGIFEASELVIAATQNFSVVFHNAYQIEWLHKNSCPLLIQAWLKINTGMGRLGFNLQEAMKAYNQLQMDPHIAKPLRILSHFACSDVKDHPLNQQQIHAFQSFIKNTQAQYSFCNSSALFNFTNCHYDYVRPGLALYGVSPLHSIPAKELGLKPVMTLQSSLIAIKHMQKGESIGYGARYICPEEMPVGVVAFGYGDGYPISAQDGTPVLINHTECPLIGRVSMDMLTVDLRPCLNAHVGDPVILWGEGLPIERIIEHTPGHITYDLLTGIQHRVRFLWTTTPNL